MIKYFCDRCGAECSRLHDCKIHYKKGSLGFETRTVHVCRECNDEADRLHDISTDVHLALFKDFLKGGAE